MQELTILVLALQNALSQIYKDGTPCVNNVHCFVHRYSRVEAGIMRRVVL